MMIDFDMAWFAEGDKMAEHTDEREKALAVAFKNRYDYDDDPKVRTDNEQDFIEGFRAGYAAGRAEWVAVEDRLPDEKKWYECTVVEAQTPEPYVQNVAWSGSWRTSPTVKVIAWRELPAPYHPQGENR